MRWTGGPAAYWITGVSLTRAADTARTPGLQFDKDNLCTLPIVPLVFQRFWRCENPLTDIPIRGGTAQERIIVQSHPHPLHRSICADKYCGGVYVYALISKLRSDIPCAAGSNRPSH